ncbi:CubicO group peptidase (beta-lactamase class C family) [Anseongella ginsenosidimutans]|uniref:CubicO group peptidase (Beta-lactamase class C family) n=1 Tax=Anseongella ginsenosidimutans TaxID=496056 RepID=A0A4V2UTD4_9SPHI|nr:serine hydrolase domain-containing protein [Anseongella ginsenosidimutans]QEC52743.1 beta-lactamase family protein [Anseongella ginsenosidimutans]TCS85499.1 CubicO group peptidase (beta-lactamase class C family) [Anseongella ginsenosidimutans]
MRCTSLFYLLLSAGALLFYGCGNKSTRDAESYQESKSCIEEELEISDRKADKIRKKINAAEKAASIDSIFRIKRREGFNGNVLIAQQGVKIYEKSFGYGNMKKKDSLHLKSRFQLASLSKTFTAVATLMLKEHGHLKLTDTVQQYFPDFPYPGVRIRDMLSHRSGLPNYMYAFDDSLGRVEALPDNARIMHWFDIAEPTVAPYSLPDKHFAYNNTNYIVLAAIIEKITGMKYGEYLKMAIFDPLGMKDTWTATDPPDSLNVHETTGYDKGRAVPQDFFDRVVGDKGIYSTIEDLFIWYKALNTECLLKKETLEEAFTPRSFERPGVKNYGYGFRMYLEENDKPEYIYHNGWWKGYSSLFWFSPKDEFVIIILANRYNGTVYRIKELLPILHGHSNGENVEEEIRD